MSAAASARRRFARIRGVVVEFPVAPRPKVAQGDPPPPLLPPRATMTARPIPDAPLGDPAGDWREPSRVLRAVMSDGWVEPDGPEALRFLDAAALLDLHLAAAEWIIALHPDPSVRAYGHRLADAGEAVLNGAKDADGRAVPVGRIAFRDAVAAAVAFFTAKIDPAALDAALTPTRRGPRPGLYGTPLRLRRLRTDAARAAAPLVAEIDRRLARIAAIARAQASEGPADARRVARLGHALDRLAASLAKRNARALRGLGPKEPTT